jgi:DNA invertase Pin-like site-specific DNA recombinase
MAKRIKAYSYTRFSTPEQSHGDSARRQLALAEEYARRHDLDLDETLTFRDLGVSAYRGRNAEDGRLGDFLRAVDSGAVAQGSFLLVENLDRISRETARKATRTLEAIVDAGVTLVTMSDGKAYTAKSLNEDHLSFVMAILTFVRAHEESAMKGSRIRAAWENKRQRAIADGTPLTKLTPGWLVLGANGTLRLDAKKAAIIRRIFKLALEGVGSHTIAARFNQEKVAAFRTDRWHRTYIRKILENPAVIGRLVACRIEYEGGRKVRKVAAQVENHFPAAVSMDDWTRLQAMQDTGPSSGSRARAAPRGDGALQNVLASLARCPRCNGTMTRISKGPTGGYAYLTCAKAKLGAGCERRNVRMAHVETAILDGMQAILGTIPSGDDAADKRLEALDVGLTMMAERAARITGAIAQRGTTGALGRELDKIDAEIAGMEAERAAVAATIADAPLLDMKVTELHDEITAKKPDRQRVNALLRQMARAVVVDYRSGRLVFQWKHGGESELVFAATAQTEPGGWVYRPEPRITA